ncbi:MAG TPA: SUMF1/EgtB/PvdO family nonheme iron enzyme [Myxococcota bacterium]|nr:SUMF1/EgtB/PvdO family nonheme iron enzyme [Myxococcota bacterium]
MVWLISCISGEEVVVGPGLDQTDDSSVIEGPCADDMVEVEDFCIDRYEAFVTDGVAENGEGETPTGYHSGEQAELYCEAADKRLCTSEEWLHACQGEPPTTWPYGDTYDPTACNDSYPGGHPVVDYFGTSDGTWNTEHMNDPGINEQPDTVDPSGENLSCVSIDGVYDLHGNLHEWVAESVFRGGFYADAELNGPGCT